MRKTKPSIRVKKIRADSNKGGEGVNVRDKTCIKNWATGKTKSKPAWVLAPPRKVAN